MVDHRGTPVIGLWREVKRRVGRLHITRHRDMLMRDPPCAHHLPEAHRHAYPGLSCLTGDPRAPDLIEAVTERHLIAYRETQVTCLIVNRTLHRGEPCREVLS